MKNNILISIVGPTAIGKTSLSIKVAEFFQTEIISADSRQFFKEMNIGTAVPTKFELQTVQHHFIQHKSITEAYTVGDFEREAIEKLNEIFQNQKIAVMVGGSGLYVDAVINGLDEFPRVDPNIRKKLNEQLEKEGILPLQKQLEALDPQYFSAVDINNPQRVIRALVVCLSSGKAYSSFLNLKKPKRNFSTIKIGLHAPREIIYNRINERVDTMIKEGLVQEAEALQDYKHANALNTVGYKELFAYFDGNLELTEAISEIKKNTRRFAKRQLTWFRKDSDIHWFDYDTPAPEIFQFIKTSLRRS